MPIYIEIIIINLVRDSNLQNISIGLSEQIIDKLANATGTIHKTTYDGLGVDSLGNALDAKKYVEQHLNKAVELDPSIAASVEEIRIKLPAAVAAQELRDARKLLANLTTQSGNDADEAEERFDKIAEHLKGYLDHVPADQKADAQQLVNDLLAEADTVVARHIAIQAHQDARGLEGRAFESADAVESFASKIRKRLARSATTDDVFPTSEDQQSFEKMVAEKKLRTAQADHPLS